MESRKKKSGFGFFQMPLHYPRYSKKEYVDMPEWKLDRRNMGCLRMVIWLTSGSSRWEPFSGLIQSLLLTIALKMLLQYYFPARKLYN